MKKLLFIFLLCSCYIGFGQAETTIDENKTEENKKEENKSKDNITTTVITLDLSRPHDKSIKHSNGKNKLTVKNRNLLAFNLIKGNPFRFRYVLNFKKVELFTNMTFNPKAKDSASDPNSKNEKDDDFNEEGMADKDGDGVDDPVDECPNIAGPASNNGCPYTEEEITENIIKEQYLLKESLSKLKIEINNHISEISNDSELDINDFNSNNIKFKNKYLEYIEDISNIKNIILLLKSIDNTIIQNQKEINSSIESTRLLIEKLLATKTRTYLLPIDINGENIDYIEIQLDIYDGDNETPETYKYKVWIKGGLKIDISGGVHITSLFDNEYYTTDSENNEKMIHQNDLGDYDFGFGTMVNVSLRGGSWVRPTLNFGVLFTSNQKFQMLTGLGFILGKNERIIVHAGISMGRVNVLKNNYVADGSSSYDLGADGNIPLNEKFKFGKFFGITYNFGKPKSNKDK